MPDNLRKFDAVKDFDELVERWRRCVRLGLEHRSAFYYKRMLVMKGYRGEAVKMPWYYRIRSRLIYFRMEG